MLSEAFLETSPGCWVGRLPLRQSCFLSKLVFLVKVCRHTTIHARRQFVTRWSHRSLPFCSHLCSTVRSLEPSRSGSCSDSCSTGGSSDHSHQEIKAPWRLELPYSSRTSRLVCSTLIISIISCCVASCSIPDGNQVCLVKFISVPWSIGFKLKTAEQLYRTPIPNKLERNIDRQVKFSSQNNLIHDDTGGNDRNAEEIFTGRYEGRHCAQVHCDL